VTAVVAELVLLALAMMMATIVAIIALSIGPVALALVGDVVYLERILFFQLTA
jgi:hypothetical protein